MDKKCLLPYFYFFCVNEKCQFDEYYLFKRQSYDRPFCLHASGTKVDYTSARKYFCFQKQDYDMVMVLCNFTFLGEGALV